jgi:hypothetical protein
LVLKKGITMGKSAKFDNHDDFENDDFVAYDMNHKHKSRKVFNKENRRQKEKNRVQWLNDWDD